MYLLLLIVDDVLWRDEFGTWMVPWLLFGFGESLLSKDACDVWFFRYMNDLQMCVLTFALLLARVLAIARVGRQNEDKLTPKKRQNLGQTSSDGVAPDPVIASSNIPKALEFKKS